MKSGIKRIVAFVLAFSIVFSTQVIEAIAAGAPEINYQTPGGTGPYKTSGILFKVEFAKPSEYGITKDNFSKSNAASDVTFTSVSNRLAFEMMTSRSSGWGTMGRPQYTSGEKDSAVFGQFYAKESEFTGTYKFTDNFYILKDKFSAYNPTWVTGHYMIFSSGLSGVNNWSYKEAGGLLTFWNVFITPLLEASDNGMSWDGQKISQAFYDVWAKYVDSTSANFTDANAIRLRNELASLFMTQDTIVDGLGYMSDFFTNQIAVGKQPPGFGAPIKTEAQAANLQNLLMLSIAMVLGNPAGGCYDYKVGNINGNTTFKGWTYLDNIINWIKSGGNSDTSDYHMFLKAEVYGLKGTPSSGIFAERWDMAQYNFTSNTDLGAMSVSPQIYSGQSGARRFVFAAGNYTTAAADVFTSEAVNAVAKANKNIGLTPRLMNGSSVAYSAWSFFQRWGFGVKGNIEQRTKSYNIRGVVETLHPDVNMALSAGADNTINIGVGYYWPNRPNSGVSNTPSYLPNFKQDDELFSDSLEIGEGEKASATNYLSLMAPTPNNNVINNKNLFSVTSDEWRTNSEEVENLLQVIHRATYGGGNQLSNPGEQIPNSLAEGYTYDRIPVVITIDRSFSGNEPDDTSDKILDDLYAGSTTIQDCGQHDFKVLKDEDNQAVIAFNIIPSSGSCGELYTHNTVSPIEPNEDGYDGNNNITIQNCFVSHLYKQAWSRIKFNDTDIAITEEPGKSTTVNYDFSYVVYKPGFKSNEKSYGDDSTDKIKSKTNISGKGYATVPNGYNQAYPNTDYASAGATYVMSDKIRRSITYTRSNKDPSYTNVGYESKNPYYSEIKTNSPDNETFEAMAGTPTTRDLFMSTGATDFRVDFKAEGEEVVNGETYRVYKYIVNVSNCWGNEDPCSGSCSCTDSEGNPVNHGPMGCGVPSCGSHPTNHFHPDSHTWEYSIKIPIESFTYFDMTDTEVWRLAQWGLEGGSEYLSEENPTKEMGTKVWGLNTGNYSPQSGRIVFSAAQKSNNEGDKAKFGDNTRSFSVSSGKEDDLRKQALELVNNAVSSEDPVTGSVVSDYIVLKTSEGYQVPYFYSQPFANTVKVSSVGKFTESTTQLTTEPLKVDKQLTIDDFWWKNSNKLTCASEENGWSNSSITYGGYNGQYNKMNEKYMNDAHDAFLNNNNPLADLLSKYGIGINSYYANQITDGSGSCTFGKDFGNNEHVFKGLDVIDTIQNGEYDTGNMWLQYDRVMLYEDNSKYDPKSNKSSKFAMTGAGVCRVDHIPYYDGAPDVNDIVIHDPVSSQYAVVVSNDEIYDDRTNAELMQGGDPIGTVSGVCPEVGCQYSTLTCDEPIVPHSDSCYMDTTLSAVHVGGNNVHVHTDACSHVHTDECYPEQEVWYHDTSGCSYSWEKHVTTSSTVCTYCGHSCGHYLGKVSGTETGSNPICGMEENKCTGELNSHKCTEACTITTKKVLNCDNPHHYEPGDPVNPKDERFHYPIGDPRCWTRCGKDENHGSKVEIEVPGSGTVSMGGTFINLDREFKIYFPFIGDFAEDPSLQGIQETTDTRGHGFTNGMDTREWTSHRWVVFPVNVLDPLGNMRLAGERIDLNEFSEDETVFEFYCVLANDEHASSEVRFLSTAINSPNLNEDEYYDESTGDTNKDRVDDKFAARHTARKYHYIDVVGTIGALTINDTGDYRFANLFKQSKNDGTWLIPNLVPEVHLGEPNFVVAHKVTSRRDDATERTSWLDTYGNMFNPLGGKSGGINAEKEPLSLPLVPAYNNIAALRNQPMRPGYQLYMDVETIGNYYGQTQNPDTGEFLDNNMMQKMQIRPLYYSLDLNTKEYTPVDVYYGVNNEYMKVYDYTYDTSNEDNSVKDFYYYLDWLNESSRRNNTDSENEATYSAIDRKNEESSYDDSDFGGSYGDDSGTKTPGYRYPNSERDVIGSANVLFLNDLNRTFIGSEYTYGVDMNPGDLLPKAYYNEQSQRWHFTLGLPSSAVFVEHGKDCTEENIKKLQSDDKVIVCALDIKVAGDIWTLQYDGLNQNNPTGKFKIFEDGGYYEPPKFDKDGNPTNDPEEDVTSSCPIVVVYDSIKTSKDDVISGGIH